MEARLVRAALLVAAILSLGAGRPVSGQSVRSQNFIVSAPTPQLAKEICQAAEAFRRDLAIEWLGQELPPWQAPCPIRPKWPRTWAPAARRALSFSGGMPTRVDDEDSRLARADSRQRAAARSDAHDFRHALWPAAAAVGRRRGVHDRRARQREGQAGQVPDPLPRRRQTAAFRSTRCSR